MNQAAFLPEDPSVRTPMMSLSFRIAAAGGTSPDLAHRVISLLRSTSIAQGQRTSASKSGMSFIASRVQRPEGNTLPAVYGDGPGSGKSHSLAALTMQERG